MKNIGRREITSNIIPAVAFLIITWIIILIPFRIIGYGFLPQDDALRHSAKVISGKDWGEILVLRDEIKMDSHPGWHAILGFVHGITKWDGHSLVLFSVISLFILFSLTPLFFLRYPETWIIALITLAIAIPAWFYRLFLGRPYIFTMSFLLVLSFLWPTLRNKKISYKTLAVLTAMIAASTWIHCSWYLFLLPIAALFLAREWRAGLFLSVTSIIGVAIGAACTAHPILFIKQTLMHLFLAFGTYDMQHMLVTEFRPTLGDFNIVIAVVGILGWRALCGRWNRKIIDNPLFILGGLTFVLGFITRRLLLDWGVPVIAAWMAQNFEELIRDKINALSLRRLTLAVLLGGIFYLSITSDAENRWTSQRMWYYLSTDDPERADWLPGPGGIVYSDNMGVFYQTFFKNPHADWRYILGFEPGLMPEEDLTIFRNIQRNFGTYKSFEPWVKKMRPEDRLVIIGNSRNKPEIPELQWCYTAYGTWVGRKPKDVNQNK